MNAGIFKKFMFAAVVSGVLPSLAFASPTDDCLDIDGSIDDDGFCVVIDVEQEPFARMVRAAGVSGLGWTVVGLATTTTVTMYELEYTTGGETEVFVEGDPTLPGCNASSNQPKKCSDHYETVTGADTYAWLEIFRESNTAYENTSCMNPANKDMGHHRQCGF